MLTPDTNEPWPCSASYQFWAVPAVEQIQESLNLCEWTEQKPKTDLPRKGKLRKWLCEEAHRSPLTPLEEYELSGRARQNGTREWVGQRVGPEKGVEDNWHRQRSKLKVEICISQSCEAHGSREKLFCLLCWQAIPSLLEPMESCLGLAVPLSDHRGECWVFIWCGIRSLTPTHQFDSVRKDSHSKSLHW